MKAGKKAMKAMKAMKAKKPVRERVSKSTQESRQRVDEEDDEETRRQKTQFAEWSRENTRPEASSKTREQAQSLVVLYSQLDPSMTKTFVENFHASKKSKDFSWTKTFHESLTGSHKEEAKVGQNYLTPSLPYLLFSMHA
jgi:hypothetical protein